MVALQPAGIVVGDEVAECVDQIDDVRGRLVREISSRRSGSRADRSGGTRTTAQRARVARALAGAALARASKTSK